MAAACGVTAAVAINSELVADDIRLALLVSAAEGAPERMPSSAA